MANDIDGVDLDLVDVINTLIPFEKHLPGMNYCGPGTNLKKKLLEDGVTPRKEYLPVDRVDEIAREHDLQYNKYDDLNHRLDADIIMVKKLKKIKNATCRETLERIIVLSIMTIKIFFGKMFIRIFGSKVAENKI